MRSRGCWNATWVGWWPCNPQKTRAIAEAKVTTDKVDAAVLAGLLAAHYLPSVWLPDDQTHALRRQVTRRAHVVRQRTRLENQVQSILPPQPHPALPGRRPVRPQGSGLAGHPGPPPGEHQAVGALLRQLDFHAQELRIVDAELGRVGLERAEVRRLVTIPGVDATVALAIVAAVGDFGRFSSPQRLVSYLGLEPARAAVRRPTSPARPDQQARPRPRPRHAGRGRLGRGQDPRAAARLLRARPRPARHGRSPWWPPPASSPRCAGT
jgi:transposase